ncbi:MAG: BlaI/MecI/CopY family transcriptional regulator [Gammaproteobacteria bacterium]|nr:BlaI/MecI/CopY family transcriptional regulator [Gammaproteobacteria bacterium]
MRLSEFELDVMQQVWRRGRCSAPDVHCGVASSRNVAYTTVKTILDRLERKGCLVRVGADGRAILYEAAVSRATVQQSMLERFVAHVFAGDRRPMLTQLLRDETLTPTELQHLRDLLSDRQADGGESDA